MKSIVISALVLAFALFLFGCEGFPPKNVELSSEYPSIFPDYTGVTVPVNIAPLNFRASDKSRIRVEFRRRGEIVIACTGDPAIDLPLKKWRELLASCAGNSFEVQVFQLRKSTSSDPSGGKEVWLKYRPFEIRVSADSIDSYLAYRLIAPGYERWGEMGIYMRRTSDFDEATVIDNSLADKGCVNCHAFADYDAGNFMFHYRGTNGGTFVLRDGEYFMVDTKTEHAASPGSYPAWHPSGRYIAFACGVTRQAFHALPGKKIEVYDLESNLMVFKVDEKQALMEARFNEDSIWETFPSWSPDGKSLYYCAAEARTMPFEYKDLKYGLYRVDFDPETGKFSAETDTLIAADTSGRSISFPRVSPDGKYLMYTESACATFPIWHPEADLKLMELSTGKELDISMINSADTESYHSWSSNGRWIVFSSRRIDGLYTRLFLAYFGRDAVIHKPFLLPQKSPDFNTSLLKSYNIPEFSRTKPQTSPYEISKSIEGQRTKLSERMFK
ncbi:MAG: hypothetical protein LBC98_01625 [Prevotellaceae bacterium]|jgi:dipeptidyl aminopeptidase/acylaminoacyl peptidase|nr:hypothetical protein [Prevotellaceae bacterium]